MSTQLNAPLKEKANTKLCKNYYSFRNRSAQQIKEQIKRLTNQFDQTNFPDIPGLGDTAKATIISETSDIGKQRKDPVIHQSGKHKTQRNIEKREQSIKKDILQLSNKGGKAN
uniref:Uncharacterized protein n=1 Tax=Fervidobacterium thailandense TaxID=1008305 RepID=A0A7C4RW38_9BACT